MRLNIPPIVPYVFGAILVVFGILRAKYLGAPRVPHASSEDDDAAQTAEPVPLRGPTERRHLRWGVIYVLMGLFLLISTYVQIHRR